MKYKFRLFFASAMLVLSPEIASAACYEEVAGTTTLVCGGGQNGNSADFVTGCSYVTTPPTQVEVACPGQWVNKSHFSEPAAQTCARVGMRPSSIDGQACAAGERRPSSGTNVAGIHYTFGTKGHQSVGGTYSEMVPYSIGLSCDYVSNGGSCDPNTVMDYCWQPGAVKDNDMTDRTVAYYCE